MCVAGVSTLAFFFAIYARRAAGNAGDLPPTLATAWNAVRVLAIPSLPANARCSVNIAPELKIGIGGWPKQAFVLAMRQGVDAKRRPRCARPGGRMAAPTPFR